MRRKSSLAKWMAGSALFLGSVVALDVIYEPDDAGRTTNGPSSVTVSHETLHSDADMTQQMSTPNANTGAQVHTGDAQLDRSQSSGYVRALEQHQADIDRMLARGTP